MEKGTLVNGNKKTRVFLVKCVQHRLGVTFTFIHFQTVRNTGPNTLIIIVCQVFKKFQRLFTQVLGQRIKRFQEAIMAGVGVISDFVFVFVQTWNFNDAGHPSKKRRPPTSKTLWCQNCVLPLVRQPTTFFFACARNPTTMTSVAVFIPIGCSYQNNICRRLHCM